MEKGNRLEQAVPIALKINSLICEINSELDKLELLGYTPREINNIKYSIFNAIVTNDIKNGPQFVS